MDKNLFKKYDKPLKGGVLNKPLIEIKGHRCECCKNSEWLNQPITLQVHHIDGDKTNNTLDNLQLLCPNCHSLTENFGSKNKKRNNIISEEEFVEALKNNLSIRQALFSLGLSDANGNYTRARQIINNKNIIVGENLKEKEVLKENYCINCKKLISIGSTYCTTCLGLLHRKTKRPTRGELKELIRKKSFVEIGSIYGVSDNAIRKWCDAENLPRTKKDIKQYSDEEWNKI